MSDEVKEKVQVKQGTPPPVGEGAPDAEKAPDKEFSPEEEAQAKEIIRRQRKQRELVMECKKELDAVLQKHGCVLKINPNSPVSAPQIMVDLP